MYACDRGTLVFKRYGCICWYSINKNVEYSFARPHPSPLGFDINGYIRGAFFKTLRIQFVCQCLRYPLTLFFDAHADDVLSAVGSLVTRFFSSHPRPACVVACTEQRQRNRDNMRRFNKRVSAPINRAQEGSAPCATPCLVFWLLSILLPKET